MCGAFTPCWSWLKALAAWLSFFLLQPPPNSEGLEKSASCWDPKAFKTRSGLEELLSNLSALCFLQDL